ncbi:MAG: M3 family metallopeptidase [Elusimicrobiota bacterium]
MLTITNLKEKAKEFGYRIELPVFERTSDEIRVNAAHSMNEADKELDSIAALWDEDLSFKNTMVRLDDIFYKIGNVYSRIIFIMNTSPLKELRETCEEMILELEKWRIKTEYREDIYDKVSKCSVKINNLHGEDIRLYDHILERYKRLGFGLGKESKDEIKKIKQELSALETSFAANIREDTIKIKFSSEELSGVPEDMLSEFTRDDSGEYIINPKSASIVTKIMQNAKPEETRKKIYTARLNVAKDKNIEVLDNAVRLRARLAKLLKYESWADYKLDITMAKKKETVEKFIFGLRDKLDNKFRDELSVFENMKKNDTKDDSSKICSWDIAYYVNKLVKERYNIDLNELRKYFEYDRTLNGMFKIFEKVFGIKINEVECSYKWAQDIKLYAILDGIKDEPLGLFYLDMFPRDGKFNHFAEFGLFGAKKIGDNIYQRPVAALVCNFDRPGADTPSLLTYSQVDTLFHEFGHVLHSLLTKAKYIEHSGTNVPIDFVEVPSQVLEYWIEDKDIINSFAVDYRDKTKKIPDSFLDAMKEIKKINIAAHYRAQMAYSLIDINLHSKLDENHKEDLVRYTNNILEKTYMALPLDTAFIAGFGHLMGYDSGYYGYAWADVISADIALQFSSSKLGFFNNKLGIKFRKEILEQGDGRPVEESLRAFLGREYSIDSFFKKCGIRE